MILCLGFAGLAPRAYATPAATTTALAVTAGGSAVTTVASGTVVTLTATVLSGATAVTPGQVNFCDGSPCTGIHLLGTAQLTSAGTAVLRLKPGIGSHSYEAVFVGTSSYGTSTSSAATLSVTGSYTTTTTIAQSGSAGNYTLMATVAGLVNTHSTPPAPTGTVSFLDTTNSNAVLGTASLGAGTLAQGFVAQVAYSTGTGSNPDSIAVGDFNGDGKPDLAVANYGSSTVGIFLGNGDGTFQSQATYSTGSTSQPNFVAVGDFNGDGKLDLAVTSSTANTVSIFLGNGDGTFPTSANYTYTTGSAPTSIAVGDFNGDGKLDLAVANYGSSTVSIFLGNGDGSFQTQVTYAAGYIYPRSVTAGDFNGDGKLDLAVVIQPAGVMSIFLGNGDGTFPASANYTYTTGSQPISVTVGDFNGDGKPDLAVANLGDSTVSVLLGNGDGSFSAQVTYTTGSGPVSVAVGDFNGDGKPDLAVASQSSNTVSVLLGNGDGTFQSKVSYATGSTPNSVAVADFNGDGIPDLAVANNGGSTAGVLLGQWTETATASASGISPVGPSGSHAVEASYLGDSSFASSTSSTTSLTAQPATTALTLSANPTSSTYSQQVVLTATLSPYTAQGHGTNGDTVTFSNNGTSLGTGTLSAGVAIFNVTSLPVGTDSLTAAYAGDSNFGSSSTATPVSFSVSKGTPTISISNLPASGTYGGNFTPSFSYTGDGTASVSSNSTNVCTVTSGVVHYVGVGTCSLTASATAGTNYSAVTGTAQTFSVGKATPTVSISNLPASGTYGGNFTPSFSYTGDGTTSVSSNSTSTCTVTSGVVHYVGVGTCSLTASATAGTNYSAVTGTAQTFSIGQATATVTMGSLSQTYTGSALAATATTNPSGLTVDFTYNGSSTVPTAAGSYTVVGTISDTDYQGSATGTLVIGKATPTVSAWPTATGITYGQTLANSTLSGGTASVAGSFAWTTSTTSPGAGTQSESVTFTPTDTTDYNSVTGNVFVTVSKASPTVSAWPTASGITYGQTLASSTLTGGTASVGGSFAWTTSTTSPGAGSQSESVTFTPTDTTDYATVTGTVTLTVTKATATVTLGGLSQTYTGSALAATATTSPSGLTVDFTYNGSSTAPTAAGSYAVVGTISDANYQGSASGTLVIGKATATVSAWPLASAITYGQTLSSSTLTGGTASVAGSFAWTTSTTSLGAGSQSESVIFTPTDTADYNTVTGSVTLTVNKATPAITWSAPAAIAYGTALSAAQLDATASYNGTAVPGVFAYNPASGTVLSRGTQTLSVTFTPTDTADYNSASASVAVSVGGVTLTVSANNATKVYGTANPTFTGSISGALNGDTFTESFTTTATASSNVGTYPIVPSAAGADLENYTETIRNGTLMVTKAGSAVALTSSATNANLNASVTFTATATSATTGTPSGEVEFLDGSTVLDTAPLNSSGVATYSTTKLTAGTHSITAVYPGDANFNESTSAQYAQTVTAPDYSLAANPASLTLKAGQTGKVTFTFAPVGGYIGTVNFACTGLPANVSCSFAPSSLTADGSNKQQTSLLTITTEGPNTGTVASNNGEGSSNMVAASIFWLPGLLFGCFLLWERKKLSSPTRRLLGVLLAVAAISGMIGIVGCAFGNPQAPSGVHIVTVTATATTSAGGPGTSSSGEGLSHTAAFTLTITQ